MTAFQFHSELFEYRTKAQEVLASHGFEWLSHYGAIDMDHYRYGLEVTGIQDEDDSIEIENILKRLFPEWEKGWRYYKDDAHEQGWKIIISKLSDYSGNPIDFS